MLKDYNRCAELVRHNNQAGGTYHQLDLGENLVMEGDYDMTKYLQYYDLPADLTGKRVLDVGTASGFFALECARRGGDVTAIDIWPADSALLTAIIDATGVNVKYVQKNIYDLTPEFGLFDLVVCGSLLLHLPAQFGAVQRLKSVCSGQLILSNACTEDSQTNQEPICKFLGAPGNDAEVAYWHFWSVSGAALKQMLLTAGFAQVSEPVHFTLSAVQSRKNFATPHVLLKAS
jgi:2-polyprenyl-3-methyl-5-hydroxy-6-metoxy-1,4-benzoquinol methylase